MAASGYTLTYTGEQVQGLLDQIPVNTENIAGLSSGKVDKVAGKGLSTEDFTTADQQKLSALPTNTELNTLLGGKQDTISDLSTIRSGASAGATAYQKPGTGIPKTDLASGVQTSLGKADTALQPSDLTGIENDIAAIEGKIPSAASSSNQLADKNYVDSAISTNTATFRGTFDSLAELQAVTGATNNDYAFVIEYDAQGNEYYDRYKYNGSTWVFEYKIESTPFTADQWAAIQSGITSGDVSKLSALPTNTELNTLLGGKQDTINDLSTIRSGAAAGATAYQKPSGGIPKSDLSSSVQSSLDKADTALQTETDPVFSASPAAGITSGDITAWNAKQSALTFDSTPTANSTNPVTSGGVKTALDLKANQSTTYTKTEVDALFDDVAYLGDDDGQATTLDFDPQADTVWNIPQTLGSSQQAQARANIGVVDVSGTNDGTNWTSITIGSTTKAIPSGGGGGETNVIESISINGTTQTVTSKNVDLPVPISSTITAIVSLTEAQYTALATKDASTLYVILES